MDAFEELRRAAKALENDVDAKLVVFSKLGAALAARTFGKVAESCDGQASFDTDQKATELGQEIETALTRLSELNDSMSRTSHQLSLNPSLVHALQRHREILHDFTQEYRKTKGNIASYRETAALLRLTRQDAAVKSSADYMLRERRGLEDADRNTDEVLRHAASVHDELHSQRAVFTATQSRLQQLATRFPLINGLIGKIRRKKARNMYILAAVIATCICVLLFFGMG